MTEDINRFEKIIIASCVKISPLQDDASVRDCLEQAKFITSEYFNNEVSQSLMKTILDAYLAEKHIYSKSTLIDEMRCDMEEPTLIERVQYFMDSIRDLSTDAADVRFYIKKIKKHRLGTELRDKANKMLALLDEGSVDKANALDSEPLKYSITDIADVNIVNADTEGMELLTDTIRKKRDHPEQYKAKSWGIKALDSATGGISKKTLSLILGSSGAGKTKFLLQTAISLKQQGWNGVYFAFEQPVDTIQALYASHIARFDNAVVNDGSDVSEQDLSFINSAIKSAVVGGGTLYFVDCPRNGSPMLVREILNYFKNLGVMIDFAAIDYYKYMTWPDAKDEYTSLKYCSNDMMFLSKNWIDVNGENTGLAIIIPHQFKRGAMLKSYGTKDDVADCKALVDDAHNVVGINNGPIQKELGRISLQSIKARSGIEDVIIPIKTAFEYGIFCDEAFDDDIGDISQFCNNQKES